MKPAFDKVSTTHLITCDDKLVLLCYRAILVTEFTVLSGWVSEEEQNELYRQGRSKRKFGQSKQNMLKCRAMRLAPLPIDYNDRESFARLAGVFETIAFIEDITVRWGGDTEDGDITEFELI